MIEDSDLSQKVALLWGQREAPRRGPKSTLTVGDITRAAVQIADRDGLAAVSMARVAAELGKATMALYRHVRSKDELLLLMWESAVEGPPDLRGENGWRDMLTLWVRSLVAALRRHRWCAQVPISGPPLGPGNLAWFDSALSALSGTGLNDGERIAVVMGLLTLVHGQVRLAGDLSAGFQENPEAFSQYGAALASVVDPRRFPAIATIVANGVFEPSAGVNTDIEADIEADFEFGLTLYLDGLAALIARRAEES